MLLKQMVESRFIGQMKKGRLHMKLASLSKVIVQHMLNTSMVEELIYRTQTLGI